MLRLVYSHMVFLEVGDSHLLLSGVIFHWLILVTNNLVDYIYLFKSVIWYEKFLQLCIFCYLLCNVLFQDRNVHHLSLILNSHWLDGMSCVYTFSVGVAGLYYSAYWWWHCLDIQIKYFSFVGKMGVCDVYYEL